MIFRSLREIRISLRDPTKALPDLKTIKILRKNNKNVNMLKKSRFGAPRSGGLP